MTERSEERPATAAAVSGPRRWLERIKINRFRTVAPGTELRFSDGLHVILGKNASGKTTLLDLIAAATALDFDRPEFQDEPLELEFTLRAGELRFDAIIKRDLREATSSTMPKEIEGRRASLREEGRYVVRAPSGLQVTVVLTSDDLPQRTVEGVDPALYGMHEPLGPGHALPPLSPWGLHGLYNLWFQGSLTGSEHLEALIGQEAFLIEGSNGPFRMSEGDELLDGEPCEYRLVMADGTAVPSEQITDHELADIRSDLEHLSKKTPISLDVLLRTLYEASSYSDRSRIPPALDRLLAYVAYWNATSPERVAALYDQLEPSRTVRAVGQTLLAATRLSGDRSHARQEFLSRFLADLRTRGTPEPVIERLQKGAPDVSTERPVVPWG